LKLINLGRYLTFLGILGLVILTLCLAGFDGYRSITLYARDSGNVFAKVILQPDQQLKARLDVKIMKNNSAYLTLEKDGEEISRFADNWRETKRELIFEGDGEYSLKVVFEDPSADRRNAEVEIDWLIVR